jgi:hypothetical protein
VPINLWSSLFKGFGVLGFAGVDKRMKESKKERMNERGADV